MTEPLPLAKDIAAAIDWWRLAGVDCDFADDATDWLSDVQQSAPSDATPTAPKPRPRSENEPPAPESAATTNVAERSDLFAGEPPANLENFQKWWMEATGLDAIGPRGRVPPRGIAGADLMVLVIDPEEGDRDRLLAGPKGRLLSRFLAAAGIDEARTYIAAALPRSTPMADTSALGQSGMDEVTLHHIALAAPKRLIAFGFNIPPLIGHEPTNDPSSINTISVKSQSVPLLITEDLGSMMSMPRLKRRFWRRWIEWSAEAE